MPSASDRPVHVAMIVANDVSVDTRVRKEAAAIASTGLRVTVVGITTNGPRQARWMGNVQVIQVPVSHQLGNDQQLRQRKAAKRGLRGDGTSWFSMALKGQRKRSEQSRHDQHVAGLRHQLAARERNARIGWLREEVEQLGSANPLERAVLGRAKLLQIAQLKRRARAANARRDRARARADDTDGGDDIEQMLARFQPPAEPRSFTRLRWTPVEWRTELSSYEDYELAMGPELDELAPDIIHAHDVHCVAVAVRAAGRLRAATGTRPRLVYDAHEYIAGIPRYTPQVLGAMVRLEAEFIHRFDEVITVSQPLADLLVKNYGLHKQPRLVLNIPNRHDPQPGDPSVREAAGVPAEVPLIVYSGGVSAMRGPHTLVRALRQVPEAHVAIVTKRMTNYVQLLIMIAEQDGTSDRLHIVGFVEPHLVSGYLSTATLGVHPLVAGWANHEIALPNKLFEYVHAGLPVVVSDCRAMAELVTAHDLGGVFHSEDPDDLARAVSAVLDNLERHRSAVADKEFLATYSWEAQQDRLVQMYSELTGKSLATSGPIVTLIDDAEDTRPSAARDRPARVLIGPSNMAGQAHEWARALHQHYPDIAADSLARARDDLMFPATQVVTPRQWRNLDWQLQQTRHVLTSYSHVLCEAGRSVLGRINGGFFDDDLPAFANAGIECAVVLHGSEIRSPEIHRELEQFSPFNQPNDGLTAALTDRTAVIRDRVLRAGVPTFVTTLGLLDHVEGATWLPLAIDVAMWEADTPALSTSPIRVGHLPSNSVLKGSTFVDEVASELHAEGVIEYVRGTGLKPTEVPGFLRSVDVYVDGLVLGDYGVTACQAMAMGRLTIGNVGSRVRDRLPRDLPMVHATPATLRDVIMAAAKEPDAYVEQAQQGRGFVADLHDGRRAAAVLAEWVDRHH